MAKRFSRITVVQTVYFESQEGGSPVAYESKFSRHVDTEEQPWYRRMKVGDEWKPIEMGWIKDVALMVLENVGESEILVGQRLGNDDFTILDRYLKPGRSYRDEMPVNPERIIVCCHRNQKSTLNITLFPDGPDPSSQEPKQVFNTIIEPPQIENKEEQGG